jgi:Uma2 family endonuclease
MGRLRDVCENGRKLSLREESMMTGLLTSPAAIQTLADLLEHLGDIPPARIRFRPAPGTATEADVIDVARREDRLCELVDGVLVEKAMGFREACLAGALLALLLCEFVVPRNLGLVGGADGMIRLFPGLVRIPDVAFVSWGRIPGRRMPAEPVPSLVPDLAVEVLIEGNTDQEMARKRREHFEAGVRQVWVVDPEARTVTVYRAPGQSAVWDGSQTIEGGEILPGFVLPLPTLFAELDRQATA